MSPLRPYVAADEDAAVALSLRAWAPVFDSVENALGSELNALLHGDDWRVFQEASVRATLADVDASTWVAESADCVVGFVAIKVADADRRIGQIVMLAVDPAAQRRGIGSQLTEFATAQLRDRGMAVAVIGTGGDAGHAPARRLYEKANYTLMPIAQYFKAL
jgi:ribosomal protein S18 acetylase RimI-like enzyme